MSAWRLSRWSASLSYREARGGDTGLVLHARRRRLRRQYLAAIGFDRELGNRRRRFVRRAHLRGQLFIWRLARRYGRGNARYTHVDEFNQTAFSLGGARGFRLENWYFELGAYGSQFSLGGEVFEQNVAVGAQASRAFYNGSRLRAQLRATSVDGKGDFLGLTGDRTEAGVYYDLRWRSWNFGAHTRAEFNDSEDPIFATRWLQLGAEARYAWSPTWGFMAITSLRRTTHLRNPRHWVGGTTTGRRSRWAPRDHSGSRRSCSCASSTSATILRSRVMTMSATGSRLPSSGGTEQSHSVEW